MKVTRRDFIVISAGVGAGLTLSQLGADLGPAKAYADEIKVGKLKSAKQSTTICPYLRRRMRPCMQHGHKDRPNCQHRRRPGSSD